MFTIVISKSLIVIGRTFSALCHIIRLKPKKEEDYAPFYPNWKLSMA